jgi:hypothetical protein
MHHAIAVTLESGAVIRVGILVSATFTSLASHSIGRKASIFGGLEILTGKHNLLSFNQ